MHELLERWSKLEPERIYIIHGGCGEGGWGITYERSSFKVALGHDANESTRGAPKKIEYDIQDDGAIIVAVQEAAEARNWAWGVECYNSRSANPFYSGFVDASPDEDIMEGFKSVESDTNPAIALLSAYLQALEAQ